jgi:hypothetical protein
MGQEFSIPRIHNDTFYVGQKMILKLIIIMLQIKILKSKVVALSIFLFILKIS